MEYNKAINLKNKLNHFEDVEWSDTKLNIYGDKKESISIEVISNDKLNNEIPNDYMKNYNQTQINNLLELFNLVEKTINDHYIDSRSIYLYFHTKYIWFKISFTDYTNRSIKEVINYYKNALASYFKAYQLEK